MYFKELCYSLRLVGGYYKCSNNSEYYIHKTVIHQLNYDGGSHSEIREIMVGCEDKNVENDERHHHLDPTTTVIVGSLLYSLEYVLIYTNT